MVSMNSPNSSIRVRGGRTRHKTTSTKRSVSGDDWKYIEHLEGELSAAQSEGPSVAQEHTSKMNRMSAENRQLQAQLKDWEMRYDEEVRDFVQQHTLAERQLRIKNSNLEDYASRAKDRVAELESQLQRMQQALEGAEAANLQLEKRIEIMSELLTSSPTKVEFSADAPPRRRMQPRPRSMLPRVSNNRGSWIGSPERTPDFGAIASPIMRFTQPRDNTPEMFEPLERIISREVWSSSPHQASEQDDQPHSSMGSICSDLSTQLQTRLRPRRMRRFGGSNGPKPLVLPYTSQADHNTMTAPPLDRHETNPSLPFRRSVQLDMLGSPPPARPRAATSAIENALHSFDTRNEDDEAGFQRILSLAQQSASSRAFSYVSAGSEHTGLVSRNLLDELHAVKNDDSHNTVGGSADDEEEEDDEPLSPMDSIDPDERLFMIPVPTLLSSTPKWNAEMLEMSALDSRRDPFNPALDSIMGPFRSTRPDPDITPRAITRTRSASESSAGLSSLDRLRHSFGDLLHSPADVARVIVHVTQQRMHIPAPLLTVQWWVVGLLWGPMARRSILYSGSEEDRRSPKAKELGARTPSLALNKSMAYGTLYTSPTSGIRRRAGMAGPGKKRVGNTQQCTKEHETLLSKHSPLLWVKFSITLAFAVGVAFTSGPGSLMPGKRCTCPACKKAEQ